MISVVRCQFGGISNCRLSICSKATSPLCRLTWAGRGAGQRGCNTASWCARREAGGGPTAATRPRTTSRCQAGHPPLTSDPASPRSCRVQGGLPRVALAAGPAGAQDRPPPAGGARAEAGGRHAGRWRILGTIQKLSSC